MEDLSKWDKIGIMGGTFNPIHTGHLLLAQWAMEEAGLDGILFMPTGNSYMKDRGEMLPGSERLAMTTLAVADRDCFACSDLEVRRGGNTYTYETLETLHRMYPRSCLYFILGADCLFSIENWYCPEKIFQNCVLLAACRGGVPMETLEAKRRELEKRHGARILLMTFPNLEISSTDIRLRCREGRSIQYLVPDSVRNYISQNHYYENP
ncbi:MAG: nicotinate-nucleotide adenylyltransferase [Lachnospiraceae bacterium]|nr:nicotinate-nucleotide adenylyltransferase [Lachnospiraceae bacterium]